jgi:hypothetical protein
MAVKRVRRSRPHRTGTFRGTWGCPLTKSRTNWCYRMCVPVNGLGVCGRIAPHTLRGRTDLAIEKYLTRRRAS